MEEDVRMALSTLSVAGVLHFSRRSADLFLAGLSDAGLDAKSLRHFCLSDDVAGPLREAGCGEVHIANAPNEAAMLALLRVWPGAE
jgi:uroporphyrinogen-III synthase